MKSLISNLNNKLSKSKKTMILIIYSCYIYICYLPTNGEENFSSQIHEMNFIAAFLAVVINAINNLTLGIEDSATI